MPLMSGHRLGPYEIGGLIGGGGMGEVYSATDTRLHRGVAIKILPLNQSARPERRERFELEARAISSLSHPQICRLYDVGEYEGIRYLVMERLEGETLARRLNRGPLSPSEALHVAIQAGDALEHAHRRGLLHRDLKPENIMLTGHKGGIVKLLDFGLAKIIAPPVEGTENGIALHSSTETRQLTTEGTVVGTFQYLAPEQLDGKEASVSTDVFAFGAVLYQMITGRKAFEGSSRASLIAAILKDQPPPVSAVQRTSSGTVLSGRQMGGLPLLRDRPRGNLRSGLSARMREVADLIVRGHGTAVATRWQGIVLYAGRLTDRRRHPDSGRAVRGGHPASLVDVKLWPAGRNAYVLSPDGPRKNRLRVSLW